MEAPKTPRDVVDALGGREAVARELEVGASAISNWFKDGFPKSRIPDLLRIAQSGNIETVTLEVLLPMEAKYPYRTRPPAQTEAAA